jgi:ATP-dependent Clp protease adapter protein ClpS
MINIIASIYSSQELELPEVITPIDVANAAKVILFNDEWHTFDDVIMQLMKAIRCSSDLAESFAWEVHTKGKAMVFDGDLPDCLRVSAILEEIALHTQIEF